jgi:thymidylate kinase
MIFVISGMPAVGKSTVCKAMMKRFELGVHIPVDDLRAMVVSGIAQPLPVWTDAAARQFALARANAVQMALLYSHAGFSVAIDDVFSSNDFESDYKPHFTGNLPHCIMLLPKLEIALQRNATRTYKDFHPEALESVIKHLHAEYSAMDRQGWYTIDSSDQSVEETVDSILKAVSSI